MSILKGRVLIGHGMNSLWRMVKYSAGFIRRDCYDLRGEANCSWRRGGLLAAVVVVMVVVMVVVVIVIVFVVFVVVVVAVTCTVRELADCCLLAPITQRSAFSFITSQRIWYVRMFAYPIRV